MLGTKIKQYLDDNGLKYSYIADKAEIPITIFSAMLNEKRKISAEEYFCICKAMNVSATKFATDKEEKAG
jgi:transcriptional regulator with XRE-family HTH domain